jgi:kinesin family protein 16B
MNESHRINNFQVTVEGVSDKKLFLAKRTEEQLQEIVRRKQSLSLDLKRALPASPGDEQSSYSAETASDCNSKLSFQEMTNRKHQIASALSLLPQSVPSSVDTAETFHTAAADSPELRIFENTNTMQMSNAAKIENENNDERKENGMRDDRSTQNDVNLSQAMNENSTDVSKITSTESTRTDEEERKVQLTTMTAISENMLQDSLESPIQQNPAMKRLNQRIARQRMMVMRCLDAGTPSKEDLNRQIMILQDLQRQQIELEVSLLEDERKNNSSQQLQFDEEDDGISNDRLVINETEDVQHESNAYCSVVEPTNNSSAILLTVAQTRSQLFRNNRPNANDQETLSESLASKRSSNRGYSTVYLTVSYSERFLFSFRHI